MGLALRVLAQDADSITLGWDLPSPDVAGYRFTREAAPFVDVPSGGRRRRYSHTYDPLRASARFSRDSAWYRVDPLYVPEDGVGVYAPPSEDLLPREKVI